MEPKSRASQACNACKRRKVKCNGEQDCDQCTRLSLKCFYSTPTSTSRSRRSIIRGHVIESCSGLPAESSPQISALRSADLSRPHSSVFTASFFLDLIPDYSTYVLPTFPIITEPEFRSAVNRLGDNKNDYALVCSLGAVTWNIARDDLGESPVHLDQIISLYTEALQARAPVFSASQVTVQSVMISLFTAKCLFDGDRDVDAGYYYLREAITRLQILRIDEPEKTAQFTAMERSQRERLYWLLFIHERFDAICHYRPAILSPLPTLPEWDRSIPLMIHKGFNQIIALFRIIDADFIRNWLNKPSPSMTLKWIEQKQWELGSNIEGWEEELRHLSYMQQVDLVVTRHWLRTLIWQMALEKFLLPSDDRVEQDYMSIAFPIRLTRHLRSLLSSTPRQAVEIHSTGILQKIFDITSTTADILEHVIAPKYDSQSQTDHLDDFWFLFKFLLSMPRFPPLSRTILESKFKTISSLFPRYFSGGEELIQST